MFARELWGISRPQSQNSIQSFRFEGADMRHLLAETAKHHSTDSTFKTR